MAWLEQHRKAILAALGVALTTASAWVAPDSTWAHAITVVLAVLTVFGVYQAPNTPRDPGRDGPQ